MRVTFPDLGMQGRLGNQLFQIAGALGIADSLSAEVGLPTTWPYRKFFRISDSYFSDEPGTPAWEWYLVDPRTRVYLQDVALWAKLRYEIHQMFQPSDHARQILDSIAWYHALPQKISLHVRRGDNVGRPDWYPLPTYEYYWRALEQLPKVWPIVVFSDDIAWCRDALPEGFPSRKFFFYEGVTRPKEHEPDYLTAPYLDWIDLLLMARADAHIISNSTFAWWGAWLSNDPVLLYPDTWYGKNLLEYADPRLMFTEPRWRKVACA